MGSRFDDLDRYYDPGLTLTVKGKEYVLPLPSAELGLWCRRAAESTVEITAASTDQEMQRAVERVNARADTLPELPGDLPFEERLLGPAYRQMMADGVPDPHIQVCAETAYIWIVAGEDAAGRYWCSGGRPESVARGNRADRRANARKTSTGEVSATSSPGSTSGTSSPTRSGRNGRGRGSRGRRS